jgi:predicted permease
VNSVVSSAAEVLGARGHFIVVPINQGATSLRDRADLLRFMRLLFSVVAATLLLACLNIANLLFVRGKERAKEIGVRAALGAGSGRLARELMTESVLLATAGGIAGLIAGELALRLLSAFALPGGVTIEQLHLGVNGRVLAFTAGLSVLTAVAFGLLPALHGSRVNVVSVIRDEAFASASSPGRGALLALQVAISLVLLVAAALMVRSLRRGLETDLGFDPSHLAAVSVQPQLDGRQADNARLADEVLRVVRASPGIQSAAATSHLPLGPSRALPFAPGAAGTVPAAARRTVMLYLASVSPDYFRVLGVPVVQGRGFGGEDRTDASRVVVLNESAAQSFFPGESPIGKQINFLDDRTYTVVGVVRDTKYVSLQDRSVAFAFAPLAQEEVRGTLMFVVRADEPHVALRAVQNAVANMAPAWKLMRPRVVRDQVNAVLMPQRVGAVLLSVFAFVALVVSGVGIYGTVAYAMERRRSEIGVRMALGAQSFDVLRLVLREFSIALAAGLALGLVGGAVAAKLLSHFLYQIDPLDLPSFSAGICGVLIAAMIAVLVPSARALNVDPVCAMRSQ